MGGALMVWAIFDDKSPNHPKLLRAGAEAGWLWYAGICYSNAHGLDGRLDKDILIAVYPPLAARADRVAAKLCKEKLWHDRGDHYEIHDYEEHQERALKQEQEATKAYERDRKRKQRETRRGGQTNEAVPDIVPDIHGTDSGTSPGTVPNTSPRYGMVGLGTERDSEADRDLKPLHVASAPWLRVWQLYETATCAMQGAPSTHRESLETIAAVCADRSRRTGDSFDATIERCIRAWLADPWVREEKPSIAHLASNPGKYLDASPEPPRKPQSPARRVHVAGAQ